MARVPAPARRGRHRGWSGIIRPRSGDPDVAGDAIRGGDGGEVVARYESLRLAAAGRLLGLPAGDVDAGVRIARVVPFDTGWVFTLRGRSIPGADLLVEEASRAPRALIRLAHLAISISGPDAPVLRRLAEAIGRRLKNATPAMLARWLHDLPLKVAETPVDEPPIPEPQGEGPVAAASEKPIETPPCPGLHRAWNHPRSWSRFLADEETAMYGDCLVVAAGRSVRVEHGDLECQFLSPRAFVARSWQPIGTIDRRQRALNAVRRALQTSPRRHAVTPVVREHPVEYLFTNIVDVDVIEGATSMLEKVMASVRRHLDPEVLLVNCTCVPQIVGDDVEHVVERERRLAPYPVLYKNQSTRNPFQRNIAPMEQAFRAAAPVARDPNAVNLVGFPPGRDRHEVAALLAALGIRVNAYLVPELSPSIAQGYMAASLRAFEKGRAGAVRTVERLLDLCRMTCFKRLAAVRGRRKGME